MPGLQDRQPHKANKKKKKKGHAMQGGQEKDCAQASKRMMRCVALSISTTTTDADCCLPFFSLYTYTYVRVWHYYVISHGMFILSMHASLSIALSVARGLARAALCRHATPWFENGWRSNRRLQGWWPSFCCTPPSPTFARTWSNPEYKKKYIIVQVVYVHGRSN